MLPNRVVGYATAALGLVAALAPVVADLDWESTAGVIAGAGVIAAAALKYLDGWQKYEQRTAPRGAITHRDEFGPGS